MEWLSTNLLCFTCGSSCTCCTYMFEPSLAALIQLIGLDICAVLEETSFWRENNPQKNILGSAGIEELWNALFLVTSCSDLVQPVQ